MEITLRFTKGSSYNSDTIITIDSATRYRAEEVLKIIEEALKAKEWRAEL